MNEKIKVFVKPVTANCPHCQQRLMSIYSASRPFKPNVSEMLIATKCIRCGKDVEFILDNMKN